MQPPRARGRPEAACIGHRHHVLELPQAERQRAEGLHRSTIPIDDIKSIDSTDHGLARMFEALGARYCALEAAFEPEAGAYAGAHHPHHHDDESVHGGRIHEFPPSPRPSPKAEGEGEGR